MLYTIENPHLRAIVSEAGAELQSLQSPDGTEYLWQGDPSYWPDRALNIFPYVARLTEGRYQLDGRMYSLPIHGFAPRARFSLAYRSKTSLTLTLCDNAETYAQYPRHFIFSVRYQLIDALLQITYQVENTDTRDLYFGLGGHPGFRLPLEAGLAFSDYRLLFSSCCQPRRIGFTSNHFLDGTTSPFPLVDNVSLPLTHELFHHDAVVLENTARQVFLGSPKGTKGVTISFPSFPYLGIWHVPYTEAPYVCIEPWSSLPATAGKTSILEAHKDLIHLKPSHIYKNLWSICCHW